MKFKKALLTGIFAAAALLSGCGPAPISATLTAGDGSTVTTLVPQDSKSVIVTLQDGKQMTCVELRSERRDTNTDYHGIVCPVTKDVAARRQAYDRQAAAQVDMPAIVAPAF